MTPAPRSDLKEFPAMSRPAVRTALGALTLALASVSAAAVGAPVPGPKQPLEHAAISGGLFQVKSGKPGCFTGSGTFAAPFPVPGGAVVTGATVYVIDGQTSTNIFATLNKHDMTSGATSELARGNTSGIAGTTTIELVAVGGAIVASGQAVNMSVTVGDGTCFKGAEVHYLRTPSSTPGSTAEQPPAVGYSPAGVSEQGR
jgi:hypothetical protein